MNLSNPIYHDAGKAREHLEALLWADGPVCPHCKTRDRASKIKGGRAGLYFCNVCREQFTVTVGTVFERSKIPLNKWGFGYAFHVSLKNWHFSPPASPYVGHYLQISMVHVPQNT